MAWCEFQIVAVAGHAADYMACINLDEATWIYPHADDPMKTNIDLPRHVVTVQGRYADVGRKAELVLDGQLVAWWYTHKKTSALSVPPGDCNQSIYRRHASACCALGPKNDSP
jgi:hypothetical protein